MDRKNNKFSKKLIATALALVFQPSYLLAQSDANITAQENINRAMQTPAAQSEFTPASKRVQQPTLVLPDLGCPYATAGSWRRSAFRSPEYGC